MAVALNMYKPRMDQAMRNVIKKNGTKEPSEILSLPFWETMVWFIILPIRMTTLLKSELLGNR